MEERLDDDKVVWGTHDTLVSRKIRVVASSVSSDAQYWMIRYRGWFALIATSFLFEQ